MTGHPLDAARGIAYGTAGGILLWCALAFACWKGWL